MGTGTEMSASSSNSSCGSRRGTAGIGVWPRVSMERIEEGKAGAKAEMSEELNSSGAIFDVVEAMVEETEADAAVEMEATVETQVEMEVVTRDGVDLFVDLLPCSCLICSLVKKSNESRFLRMECRNLSFMACQQWPCNTCLSSISCHTAMPPASMHLPLLARKRIITWEENINR